MASFVGLHLGHGRASSRSLWDTQHSTAPLASQPQWGRAAVFQRLGIAAGVLEDPRRPQFQPLHLGHRRRDSVGSVKPWHAVPLRPRWDQHDQQGPEWAQPRMRGRPGPAARSFPSPGTKRCLCSGGSSGAGARGRATANELFYGSPGSSSAPGRLQPVSLVEPALTHLSTAPANPGEGGRGCLPAERPRGRCRGAGKRCEPESRAGPGARAPATARLSASEALTAVPGAQASSLSSLPTLKAPELRLFPLK